MMRLKHLLLVSFYLMTINVMIGQCTSCQLTINCPSSATYDLSSVQTVCLTGSGAFTGQLTNFNGDTLCIGTGITYNPSVAPNYNGNWTINNYGTIQNIGNLYFNAGTTFHNYSTGSITLGALYVNSSINFINEGTMTIATLTINSSANITLGGTTVISGSISNNGNLTVIGSVTSPQIVNNAGGLIIGGSSTTCNYIAATSANNAFVNNGTIGGSTSQPIVVGNSGLTLSTNASYGSATAPTSQPTNLILSSFVTTISGTFTKATTSPSGYLVLRAIGASAPASPTLNNMSTVTLGQTIGSWTVVAINNGVNALSFSDNIGTSCVRANYLVYSFNNNSTCNKYSTLAPLSNYYSITTAAPTATAQAFCTSATVANLTATGTAIKWYAASTGGTALASTTVLTNATTYYASQTLNSCESSRTAVAVTINTTAAPTATAQTFCAGATVANLTATGTAIKWYAASTGGTALATTTALTNATTYYASQTLNSCESTRTAVVVTVNTTAAPTATAQTFCSGATVANLAVTGTAIKWYAASTGGTALATTTALTNATTYYASQTLNSCESTRTAVAVTVNTTTAPTATAQSFCTSATVANLTATGTAVKWYAASTGGTALATTTALTNATTYYASQTLNSCESTRTAVVVTINTTAAPTATAQTFCAGATVANLTATGTAIQWYSALNGGTALATTTALTNATTYYASQTLNSCESTRTAVVVTVNTTAAPTAAAQTFCAGATVANLTATGTAVKWYITSTGGTALATTTVLTNATTYYASQTLNTCESTRTSVVVTVITTAAPTATASQTFCNGREVEDLNATGTAIKWYNASTGGTALAYDTNLVAGTYYASQTLNSCESARTAVSVTIIITPVPTATASQTFCAGATVANLTATGTAIKWYATSETENSLSTSTVLSPGTYYATQNLNSCESKTVLVNVYITTTAAPTAAAQSFCNAATVASLTATGAAIKWYTVPTNGTALATTVALVNGSTYYASQTLNSCESTRTPVVVTINTVVGGTVSGSSTICPAATPGKTLILSGISGNIVKWQSSTTNDFSSNVLDIANTSTTLTSSNITDTTHYRAFIQNGSCGTAYSTTATLTVTRTTWNGTDWTNGVPTATIGAIFTGNKTIDADLTACSCQVTGNSQVVVNSGFNLTVVGAVNVEATASLTLQNSANLIQISNVQNSGNIVVTKRTAPLFRLDYDFWSSPVTGTQSLQAFSPATTSNRFYTYSTATNLFNVIASPSTTTFAVGKAYLIRMPNNWLSYNPTAIGARWSGSFVGVPNNGDITVSLTDNGQGYRYNAIGNPYPSPIDIEQFLTTNANAIEGTLWFWRKTNDANNPLSYSTCTASGCTLNNKFVMYTDEEIVCSGQGFIVNAKPNQTSVVFNNSMRKAKNTDEFFKTATVNKDRYWLDIKNASDNNFSQVLIAHLPNATTAYDNGYDGIYINDCQTVLSAIVENRELVIDALPAFDPQAIVPLQFRTDVADTYTIQLSKTDGVFTDSQDVFLRDNTTGTIQDLKAGSYTFTADPGTYANRFDIIYANPLSVNQQTLTNQDVVVYKKDALLTAKSDTITIDSVKIFDINGRLLIEKNKINNNQVTFDLSSLPNEVIMMQITADNGAQITKKVIN
ncbi:hypothetical protein OX284_000620 [Flavobacterium sp. SUN046]|uniref:Ig-like domain-containing protein n=1 Tax=Flavobacterium sp. SUN046 TaxID=3002440 RepID=UPI002DBAE805|nr:hypothetical protein [Flavobacterium sp. SUN046]MEC4047917.1 hypothetical protein [Flavobacterium sp. SUN046]